MRILGGTTKTEFWDPVFGEFWLYQRWQDGLFCFLGFGITHLHLVASRVILMVLFTNLPNFLSPIPQPPIVHLRLDLVVWIVRVVGEKRRLSQMKRNGG